MWATLTLTLVALVLYVTEWISLELTSLLLLCVLLALFQFFPLIDADGKSILSYSTLISGFANPALITVLSLLVVGEGLVQTGSLNGIAQTIGSSRIPSILAIALALLTVAILSAFMNNAPVVVIFIPIMQALAKRSGTSASRILMPLSFAAIMGGSATLIGSSTNLLVSDALISMGHRGLTFFELTPIALMLGGIGFVYVAFIAPRLLPDNPSLVNSMAHGKHFISQISVTKDSELIEEAATAGQFKILPKDITVRMIQRKDAVFYPPFDDIKLQPKDILIITATRNAITEAAAKHPGIFKNEPLEEEAPSAVIQDLSKEKAAAANNGKSSASIKDKEEAAGSSPDIDFLLIEGMVGPSSKLIGRNIKQIAFYKKHKCDVLGIQRRSRMIQSRLVNIRLEAGDTLLIKGEEKNLSKLRAERDLVVLSGTTMPLPKTNKAAKAAIIFSIAIGLSAVGLVPILISSFLAATAMVMFGVLNIQQAGQAMNKQIILVIAAALALGSALHHTGGASYIASQFLAAMGDVDPAVVLSLFFLLVALLTNVLSNNACAVLFTPIAFNIAQKLNIDPMIFVITVVLAANCSYASPIGYKTNLLVMGPGQYKFNDFVKVGLPLLILIWLAFSFIAPIYWGI
ncbi:MAG: SLC13 family permease [Alphaproteobacteria bacterium]|nr:SLC13 family permease [Alphaproteobacteria bacterium]